jgi:hypothetical protein
VRAVVDTYPELVAEAHDRKSVVPAANQTSSVSQQAAQPVINAQQSPEATTGGVNAPSTTGQSSAAKPTSAVEQVDGKQFAFCRRVLR